MKFGDKLIALRKKNGLSQEELAAKLNVSRQSVSKWESNNSYPETDKIVQICNLFNCSMDDLINDNIKNIENIDRKNKNNINIVFDSFLEFITKTINMFCDMKFISGLKCIIEMIIMAFILFIGGLLFINLSRDIILNLFSYIPDAGYYILSNMLTGLLSILCFIFSIIVLVHIFKIRYLNYYDKILIKKEDEYEEDKKDKKDKINFEKKETIVIRDEEHRPFAFLSVFSKIIIFFVKLIISFFSFFCCVSLLILVISLVISLSLSIYSTIFIGVDITILSIIVINILILIIFIHFIFNKKGNYKMMLIIFLTSILVCGIGLGISIISFKNINIVDNIDDILKVSKKEEKIKYNENIIINPSIVDSIEYIIDDNQSNIKFELEYDNRFNLPHITTYNHYGFKETEIYMQTANNFKDIYSVVINDIKNNILRTYDSAVYLNIKVYASKDTIKQIIENTKKIYLVDVEETDSGYIVSNYENKIIDNANCNLDYDAKNDIITIYDNDCKCSSTQVNDKINIICSYEE